MSALRILTIFVLVLSICIPVEADDYSGSWSSENREEANIQDSFETGSFLDKRNPAECDVTNENAPGRDFQRICSLPAASIDIRHAPVYLILTILRQ
jgi:hypothetical protein